jgi:hypothetical protein
MGINTLSAITWENQTGQSLAITAPWIATLKTTGSGSGAGRVKGIWQADLALDGVAGRSNALNAVTILDDLDYSSWTIGGTIGTIKAGPAAFNTIRSSGGVNSITLTSSSHNDFLAGIDDALTDAAADYDSFVVAAKISTFKILGDGSKNVLFDDTNISAATIGTINLLNADFSTSGIFTRRSGTALPITKATCIDTTGLAMTSWSYPPKPGKAFTWPDAFQFFVSGDVGH